MRRFSVLPVLVLAIMGLTMQSALATSGAHFFSATSSVSDSGALVVNWDEAGVGQQQVNYTLSTQATATYACINGGGNHPKASNKETFNGPLNTPSTPFLPDNGRVQGTLSVGPLSGGTFSCPSGQSLVLAKVSYSNITLHDDTNNVTAHPADVCRSFSSLFPC
jgi:hypothetical protein